MNSVEKNPPLVMLRAATDFAAFANGARGRSDALLTVRVRSNGRPETRLGLATGKNLGNAIARNRVRRQLRAILRVLSPNFSGGQDLLLIARPACVAASSAELAQSCERLLSTVGVLAVKI